METSSIVNCIYPYTAKIQHREGRTFLTCKNKCSPILKCRHSYKTKYGFVLNKTKVLNRSLSQNGKNITKGRSDILNLLKNLLQHSNASIVNRRKTDIFVIIKQFLTAFIPQRQQYYERGEFNFPSVKKMIPILECRHY